MDCSRSAVSSSLTRRRVLGPNEPSFLETGDKGGFKALRLFPALVPQHDLKLARRSAFAEFGIGLFGNTLVQGSSCAIQSGDLLLGFRSDRQDHKAHGEQNYSPHHSIPHFGRETQLGSVGTRPFFSRQLPTGVGFFEP
jgi:hypothetical protein